MTHEERTRNSIRPLERIGSVLGGWARFHRENPFTSGLFNRFAVSFLIDKTLDNVVYPWTQMHFGTMLGIALMTAASAVICLLFLAHYDYARNDTYGLEKEKFLVKQYVGVDISEKVHTSKLWGLSALLLLPILTDPFTALARIRRRDDYTMTSGYWSFFWTAVIVGNLGWGVWIAAFLWAARELSEAFGQSGNQLFILAIAAVSLIVLTFLVAAALKPIVNRALSLHRRSALAEQVEW